MSLYGKSLIYLITATGVGFCLLNLSAPSEEYKKKLEQYNQTTDRATLDVLRKSAASSEFLARQNPSKQTKDT